jgi:hypothetical protein
MLLLIAAIVMMRRFQWSYYYPFKIFTMLLVCGVFLAAGLAYATGVNDKLYIKLIEEPGAGDTFFAKFYCLLANQEIDTTHALRGEVMYADKNSLVIQTPNLNVFEIALTEETQLPDNDKIEKFDFVKMIGEHRDGVFVASVVKKYPLSEGNMPISRDEEDCVNKQEWEHKKKVAEQRREMVEIPMTPIMGTAELIRSID